MKKILFIVLIIIVLAILIFAAFMFFASRPLTKYKAKDAIDSLLKSQLGKKNVTQAIVLVDSPKHGIHQTFAHGSLDNTPITADQPFHIASVGKAFTATLIGTLIDEGKLNLDDKITDYLDDDLLEGLFVYNGVDYKNEVTIAQLLNHTSGIADYFADDVTGTDKMQELVVQNPDRFWTPEELVAFTRSYQSPVAKPNDTYHYSDTGYILLGMIIQNASGKSFDAMLHDRIFTPLKMDDSYLLFYSQPKNGIKPIGDVHLAGTNIKDYQSLSIDWAGGGIVSTANDLAVFVRALYLGQIVSQETLESMHQFNHKFMEGIHYSYGFMEYHFDEFFPTLSMLPNYTGHMGILGTQMFYDAQSDAVYISSFGSTDYASGSVQTMIKVLSILERIK